MGIRFDKDSRRAVNGPMIFFTDPASEAALCREIRSDIINGLAVYAYRRPGDLMITYGASETVVEGIADAGFVVAAFHPSLPYLTIPYRGRKSGSKPQFPTLPFPATSTTRQEHAAEIEGIKEALRGAGGGKIIASRRIISRGRADVAATFAELCRRNPHAFVFLFSTPQTGCWTGASPELLLESRRSDLFTMALAGTRPAGTSGPWDEKNIEEQGMVVRFISDTLSAHGLKPSLEADTTRNAGKAEHICTPITATPDQPLTPAELSSLLHDLSPTPALCGLPRRLALDTIEKFEPDGRGCYGGFCGPYRSTSEFSFHAILRCARIDSTAFCLYAGGGITLRSDPEDEWNETELKASTLREALVMDSN